ncbi:MAG: chromosomal replication initiator protein DnaA [Candidatus Promineifilaceae bacterium]|nr:chromosomal replication initiator protein DnaA [Candidatus Promineifilaceae bacterium]
MTPENAWKATLGELELQMTKATFNTWLKDARLLATEGDVYVIGVRNDYAKDWLEGRLRETILRTLSAIIRETVGIRFVVWSDEIISPAPEVKIAGQKKKKSTKKSKSAAEVFLVNGQRNAKRPTLQSPTPSPAINRTHPGPQTSDNGDALNRRFTFASFVVGSSNRLAHAAALSVSENPGQNYNPLFIYGGVGLGKTHLLHAIGQKCRADGYDVLYISSETFTNDLVQSIRNKTMADFREHYRTTDVLMIDDIQFIAGKESTQEELFHTFNELHSQGKQVVISSDRTPRAMVTLEERLQSRFEWGLMADIQLPDIETRKAILQSKAIDMGVEVPDDVTELIAHRVRRNIRELEGALNKVMAYAQLTGRPVDMDIVDMALSDLVRQPDKVTVDQVVAAVCKFYQVSEEAISSSSRSRTISYPRQIAMYLARTETDASLPQIGSRLGNRDHTTVLYGYEKIAKEVERDSSIRRDTMEIKATLYETSSVYT